MPPDEQNQLSIAISDHWDYGSLSMTVVVASDGKLRISFELSLVIQTVRKNWVGARLTGIGKRISY